jgi:two-component system chemotaxis sensor kinase CheA
MGDTDPVAPLIDSFRRAYREEVDFVRHAVGEQWVQNRSMQEIDGNALQDIYHHVLAEHGDDSALVQKLDAISRLPLSGLFARMGEHAEMLSSSRGKYVQVTWEDNEASVHTRVYQAVSDAMNHLVRNMVDHGIEFPPHRERVGKPHTGTIDFSVRREDGRLKIIVSDDGSGIDVDKVRERAIEMGVIRSEDTLHPQDIVRTVFSDGFSTAAATTAISGRGEGLPAVRQRIRELGGTINLATRRGRGTQFTLTIPDPGIEAYAES